MWGYLTHVQSAQSSCGFSSVYMLCGTKKIANIFLFKFSTKSNKNLFVTGLRDFSTLQ